MVSNKTRGKKASRKNEITNVRVIDEYAGNDGARVDRILAQLQNSHSQIRVLCSDTFNQNTQSAAYVSTFSGSTVRATDDFISFGQQFETYRILAIRFDVYDIAPNNATPVFLSTWHDEILYNATASFTQANVLDAPDSQVVAPGTGKSILTWFAHGTFENNFQSDEAASGPLDFGGIRVAAGPGASGFTANAPKLQIIMKAVVDFRGRV
jgi:hypothetical protein